MSLDQLKAVCKDQDIPFHCNRVGANALDITTVIQIIEKYGTLAEQLLALVLPLVPSGGALAGVLDMVLKLLQVLIPTS